MPTVIETTEPSQPRPYGQWAWTAVRLLLVLPVYAPCYLLAFGACSAWYAVCEAKADARWFWRGE